MKTQFNLITKPNQSIILTVDLISKLSNKVKYEKYSYNKIEIFKYHISIKSSQIYLLISPSNIDKSLFNKRAIGSFIYNLSIKYSISSLTLNNLTPSLDSSFLSAI